MSANGSTAPGLGGPDVPRSADTAVPPLPGVPRPAPTSTAGPPPLGPSTTGQGPSIGSGKPPTAGAGAGAASTAASGDGKPANAPPRKRNLFMIDQSMTGKFWNSSIKRLARAQEADVAGVKQPDARTPFKNGRDLAERLAVFHTAYVPDKTPEAVARWDDHYHKHAKRLCDKAKHVLDTWHGLLEPKAQSTPTDPIIKPHAPSCATIELHKMIIRDERKEIAAAKSLMRARDRRRQAGQHRVTQILRAKATAAVRAQVAAQRAAERAAEQAAAAEKAAKERALAKERREVELRNIRSVMSQLHEDLAMRTRIDQQMDMARANSHNEVAVQLVVQTNRDGIAKTETQRLMLRVPPAGTPWLKADVIGLFTVSSVPVRDKSTAGPGGERPGTQPPKPTPPPQQQQQSQLGLSRLEPPQQLQQRPPSAGTPVKQVGRISVTSMPSQPKAPKPSPPTTTGNGSSSTTAPSSSTVTPSGALAVPRGGALDAQHKASQKMSLQGNGELRIPGSVDTVSHQKEEKERLMRERALEKEKQAKIRAEMLKEKAKQAEILAAKLAARAAAAAAAVAAAAAASDSGKAGGDGAPKRVRDEGASNGQSADGAGPAGEHGDERPTKRAKP